MATTTGAEITQGLDAFRSLVAQQQPTWPDAAALADVSARLAASAPRRQ